MPQAAKERLPEQCRLDIACVTPGSRAEKYADLFWRTDALADAVMDEFSRMPEGAWRGILDRALSQGIEAVPDAPAALRALFHQLDHVPFWVDREQCDLGGATLLRCRLIFAVLAMASLPIIYSWPVGNKPLALSGQLVHRASQRLKDTTRYVFAICQPGGLSRFSEGFAMTVRVRLIHAQVRRLLRQSGQWQTEKWGAPINQIHMAGTNLMFSVGALEALDRFGYRFNAVERESLIHLWRYAGYLLGIDNELLVAGEWEGRRLLDTIFAFEPAPDEDSRALVDALMETTLHFLRGLPFGRLFTRNLCYGISRALIGEQRAHMLGYPKTAWRWLVTAIHPATRIIETARIFSTHVQALAKVAGRKAFRRLLGERGLKGATGPFPIPRAIAVRTGTDPWSKSPGQRSPSHQCAVDGGTR